MTQPGSNMQKFLLDSDRAVIRGRDGWFLVNRHDTYIGKAIETYGEYAGIELQTLQMLIDAGNSVIDVGANIGAHTVGLANKVGPAGQVYAYEPQRACYAMLQSQLALNNLAQVTAFNLGCGTLQGVSWHAVPDTTATGNFGAVALSPVRSAGAEAVRVMPLDMLHDPEVPVRLIKIDVEGMEADVIAGGRGLIARQKPILYVENDRPEKSTALLELIFGLGYRAWWHLPPLFNPGNFFAAAQNDFGELRSINMICLPAGMPFKGVDALREVRLEAPHPAQSW